MDEKDKLILPRIAEAASRAAVTQNATKKLGELLSPEGLLATLKAIGEAVTPFMDGVAQWYAENKETVDGVRKFFEVFEEELRLFDETHQKALDILKQYRWILTPSTLPLIMVVPIVNLAKQKGDQSHAIDELFVNHFTADNYKNLSEMVERWSGLPIFEDRMMFFRDSLVTLQNTHDGYNPSNIVIPTLVSQVDGIQMRFMVLSGLTPLNDIATKWGNGDGKVYNKSSGKKAFFDEKTKTQQMFLSEELKVLAGDYIFEDLFGEALPFRAAASTFNRHKIQHGEITDYGTLANTIRAFLVLDVLAALCKGLKK